MLEGLALGLSEALSWNQLLVILLSTIVGLLVGIIPGLGPVKAERYGEALLRVVAEYGQSA